VYYNLGELDDSLSFALGAGQYFDVSDTSEYVTTIICKCRYFITIFEEKKLTQIYDNS
jgi:hypothetical protein